MPFLTLFMMDYSIIIPAHNEEKYIGKTLDSLRNLTGAAYEVIVVANGCTDKTEETVKSWQGKEKPEIQLLSLPAANASVARNAGALKSSGNTLIFLDADTRVGADFFHAVEHGFTNECAVASVKSSPNTATLPFRLMLGFKNFYLSAGLYKGCSGVLICRKEDFHAVGGYHPELKVREHRKLILKLMEKAAERGEQRERGEQHNGRKQYRSRSFRCLNTYVTTSMRRYEQWSIFRALLFWCRQWVKDKRGSLQESGYQAVR